ncbi:MAG: N-acyl homoserine lactonase family protein [Thermoleophilia bacterium]|nr:N-acyl homoserine lactonase family protein [Thermoleophilia bacterium]
MFTITPMVVAIGPQREKSRFTYMHNFGEKVDIPYVAWLLRGEGRVILVDAGCSAEDYRTRIRGEGPLMLAGEMFQDVVDVKPIEAHLVEQGLAFDDVDTFVQTHLDWDHCMNTTKFTSSRILIQRAEWQKIPVHPLFKSTYAPKEHYEAIGRLNVEFVEGDHEVAKGVRCLFSPGHSPGGQSVCVDTAAGTYVIAGMCTIRDNFYPPEEVLAKGTYKVIPPGMHIDPILCYDSMLRLLDVGKDKVLPFHDDAVLTMGTLG